MMKGINIVLVRNMARKTRPDHGIVFKMQQ